MPRCYRCGEDKPAEEFARDRSKARGDSSICKPCDRAKSKRYYTANRERINARVKAARTPAPSVTIVCAHCGGEFEGTSRRRYCTPECFRAARSEPRGKTIAARCEWCGQEFEARFRDRARGWARFCGKHCALRARGVRERVTVTARQTGGAGSARHLPGHFGGEEGSASAPARAVL